MIVAGIANRRGPYPDCATACERNEITVTDFMREKAAHG